MPYHDPEKAREYRRAYMQQRRQDPAYKAHERDYRKAWLQTLPETNPDAHANRVQAERDRRRRKSGRVMETRPFLGYDGEGIKDRFVLLANGGGERIHDFNGLSSLACLEFLTREYDDKPIRVFFSFEYDVTMMLRDLPFANLAELAHHSMTRWEGYTIRHYPSRILRISVKGRRDVVYFDVWGFFQKSFLRVVDEYRKQGIYLSPEDSDCLEWGKEERVRFKRKDWPRIVQYNDIECRLLQAICTRLRGAITSAGMYPKAWHGPGVLAEIFLDNARSRRYVERNFKAIGLRRAYYGGRIEVLKRGRIPGPIYDYDIRSAYPTALASYRIASGPYSVTESHVPGMVGIYDVSWRIPDDSIIGPFPYRMHDGSILFPPSGKGFYHAVEVDAAIETYGEAKDPGEIGIYINRGRIAEGGAQPFRTLVEQWYEKRRQHKANGDITEIAYKLGLNSAYGKLAQRVGARRHGDMFLAGFITAHTRASLLRSVRGFHDSIIAFATDGILSHVPLPVTPGNALGEWEFETYDSVDVLMSGIYRLHKDGVPLDVKSRGWSRLDFDAVMQALDSRDPFEIGVPNRAFVTYRMAVHAPNAYGPLLGTFVDRHRMLSPETERKRRWYAPQPFKVRGRTVQGFGATWHSETQTSLPAPIPDVDSLDATPYSEPIQDREQPSDDVWIMGMPSAESTFLIDADGVPLEHQA